MKLESYLRTEVNQKIRPLFIKEKCECCGNVEDLHLHHHDRYFFELVDEVLKRLGLEMKDTDNYTEHELYLIKSCVLAEHLKCEYQTLCPICHHLAHEHKKQRKKSTKKLTKEERKAEKLRVETIRRKELLDEFIGKRLTPKEFKGITIQLNYRTYKGNLIKLPIEQIESLGYKIQKFRSRGYYVYIIFKLDY